MTESSARRAGLIGPGRPISDHDPTVPCPSWGSVRICRRKSATQNAMVTGHAIEPTSDAMSSLQFTDRAYVFGPPRQFVS